MHAPPSHNELNELGLKGNGRFGSLFLTDRFRRLRRFVRGELSSSDPLGNSTSGAWLRGRGSVGRSHRDLRFFQR